MDQEANTIAELAEKIDVHPTHLEETVQHWNGFCREGHDSGHGRDPTALLPIDTPPYYEILQWPGSANTLGSPRRNKEAQLLDPDAQPIPRYKIAGRQAAGNSPW